MDVPEIKLSQPLLIGLAVAASILAIVLYYENRSMRKEMYGTMSNKKPCNCNEQMQMRYSSPATNDVVTPAGIHPSVVTGRLNTQPMPDQIPDDPNHPPEVVI